MLHTQSDSWIDVDKINENIQFLKSCLYDALILNGEEELAKNIDNPNRVFSKATSIAKIYSLAFQIFNLSEEDAAVNYRRSLETEKGLTFFSGLLGSTLEHLKNEKIPQKKIKNIINSSYIEPVLTAHPTEAKRPEILIQHRELYLLIVQNNITHHTPYEKQSLRKKIVNKLLQLWKTSEVFFEKPTVEDELRWVIYYFINVFPEIIELLRNRIELSWSNVFATKQEDLSHCFTPNFKLATWVGGDRDGHPMITYKTTNESLLTLRRKCLQMLQKSIYELSKNIKIDEVQMGPDKDFEEWVHKKIKLGSKNAKFLIQKYRHQIIRQALICMATQIPIDKDGAPIPVSKLNKKLHYTSPQEVIKDLSVIVDYLRKKHCHIVANENVIPLIRLIETFGFHLASLDIRQNSDYHEKAFFQILALSKRKIDKNINLTQKLEILNELFNSPNIIQKDSQFKKLGKEAKEVISTCRILAEQINQNNAEAIGCYIISMTRNVFDLLLVYYFFKESKVLKKRNNKWYSPIPITPLFETIEDLKNSYDITEKFIKHSITQESYKVRNKKNNIDQLIMIGYSDSNKDGGIISSLWNLHLTQKSLIALGKKYNIKIGFFHGIGGSISRGAGPINRFLESQPNNSIDGFFRITEQGETIVQKYANKLTALFNVELLTAGVLQYSLSSSKNSINNNWGDCMKILSQTSRSKYRNLLEHSYFIDFFSNVTPIDVIEISRIGSRPSRRTGKRSLEDLRAIPWVFSWSQSRFFLSGWYGAGTAFENLEKNHPDLFNLIITSYSQFSPLRYILTNLTTSLLRSDTIIMQEYSHLLEDEEKRKTMMKIILDEKEKAEYYLHKIYGENIHNRRPRTKIVMKYREEMLNTLHRLQIVRLFKWRNLIRNNNIKEAEEHTGELLLLVNAIAAGLKTTG